MTSWALDSFLPVTFRAFLFEVCQVERELRNKLAQNASALVSDPPAPAASLRERLVRQLEEQKAGARSQGRDPEAAAFRQSQHVMAAVADEILLGFDWPERDRWSAKPLAGGYPVPDGVAEEISGQIEELLGQESPEPELAQIYLLALGTGVVPGTDAGTAGRLFAVINAGHPDLAGGPPEHLFPEAYRRQQRRGAAPLLPAVRGWLIAVLAVAAVLLAVSAPLWLDATAAARNAVTQILSPE